MQKEETGFGGKCGRKSSGRRNWEIGFMSKGGVACVDGSRKRDTDNLRLRRNYKNEGLGRTRFTKICVEESLVVESCIFA